MNQIITPKSQQEFSAYYDFRWALLRAPWQHAKGSEQDELELQSFHRMMIDSQTDDVIAVARLHFVDQFTAQIRYMVVDENQQGKGMGRQILEHLEQLAVSIGAKSITLNARDNAVQFYQSCGYELGDKTHLLYKKIQHFSMTKLLSKPEALKPPELNQLQATWHDTIPLSKAMNIAICSYDKKQLITHSDPVFNKNLHNTMFAGSIYSLATLSGWGWVYMQLQEQNLGGDIVLAEGNIKYRKPISGPGYAVVESENVDGDLSVLSQGRHGKMKILVNLYCGDLLCATFNGKYVVIAEK